MPLIYQDDVPVPKLRELLSYDPATGILRWLVKRQGTRGVGSEAGCLCKRSGYITVGIEGRHYRAHRIAWALHHGCWPEGELDHQNRNPSDNRIENLRKATAYQQKFNQKLSVTNTSGYRGIVRLKDDPRKKSPRKKRWYARIRDNGKTIALGLYETPQEASAAYEKAAKEMLGEFYRSPNQTDLVTPPAFTSSVSQIRME